MKRISKTLTLIIISGIVLITTIFNISNAQAGQIDVGFLQTCLKEEGSSLDVLVLMDSSASLRDARADDGYVRAIKDGSDPEKKRGKILKSSLKILRTLADESKRTFNISLRNFGNNSDPKELAKLTQHWVSWTDKTTDSDLNNFVEKALYDDSTMTEWASGLSTARSQFKERIGQARLAGTKSCPIMFWITDGAPTDSTSPICTGESSASIDWFRENNVLILGGLLQPKEGKDRVDASKFKPIITGENCGENKEGWTRGEVIEANDVSDLAWGFVGLISSIKNLVNLNASNSSFYVDPSTSQLEIFMRGSDQKNWQINQADGSLYCSSSNRGNRCNSVPDPEIGITTITIFPENPVKAFGKWTITPGYLENNLQVYGGLNTSSSGSNKTQPRLLVTTSNSEPEEGQDVSFQAKLVNADGTDFSLSGYKSINLCAKIESDPSRNCKSGSATATLTVSPATTDKNVGFEAVLVSAYDGNREYRITANAKINVNLSGIFPSLECKKNNPCQLTNFANKNDKPKSYLEIKPAKNGSTEGKLSLVEYSILSDKVENRNFVFQVQKVNGQVVNWNSQSDYLVPGDKLNLVASTDLAGDSEVKGVIKYKVSSNGKEITRELIFGFKVDHQSDHLLQALLLIIAYLLTIGLPYLFLLWSARRSAVLNVPDDEYSFVVLPFEITNEGKLKGMGEVPSGISFAPDYKKLEKRTLEPNSRSVSIENAQIEVIPPKWNPFRAPKTQLNIPGCYLLTSFGEQKINFESTVFSSSLIDEVIVYFSAKGNITAETVEPETSKLEVSDLDFMDSKYEEKLGDEIISPSNPVTGNVIFIVSPYLNREKSLKLLVMKLDDSLSNLDLPESISELRTASLKDAVAQAEAIKVKREDDNFKKRSKFAKKSGNNEERKDGSSAPITSIEDDEWGSSSTTRNISKDLPESEGNSESW